jgi:hypothetical protein
MRQGGDVDIVRVKVLTTPRLLADLICAALDAPPILTWAPGDSPAEVTITNTEALVTDSRLTILLGDRLDDPISVIVDGQRSSVGPTRLAGLHNLVVELTHAARLAADNAGHGNPVHDGSTGGSAG